MAHSQNIVRKATSPVIHIMIDLHQPFQPLTVSQAEEFPAGAAGLFGADLPLADRGWADI